MYCSQCGAKLSENGKFCGECGAPVEATDRQTGFIDLQQGQYDENSLHTGSPRKRRSVYLAVGGAALLIVLAAAWAVWAHTGPRLAARIFNKGEKYLEAQSYEEAITAYTDSMQKGYTGTEVYLSLSDAYMGIGDMDAAVKTIKEGLAVIPPEDEAQLVDQLLRAAEALFADEAYESVINTLDDARSVTPDNEEAYMLLGNAYLAMDELGKALTIYRDCYDATQSETAKAVITELTVNTYGNTGGNITNYGLAARQGEWIYYVTVEGIYKIRIDGTEKTLCCDDSASFINVVDKWIYYCNATDEDKLYKIRTDGTQRRKITDDTAFHIIVADGWIYYFNATMYGDLYKVRTDGELRTVLNYGWSGDINIWDGWIYYIDTYGDICKITTYGSRQETILACSDRCCYLNVVGDWMYYCVGDEHGHMYKARIDGTEETLLDDHQCAFVNVSGDWIYYVYHGAGDKLYKIRTDGTGKKKIGDDASGYISVAGDWIYYLAIGDSGYFRIRTDGTGRELIEQS